MSIIIPANSAVSGGYEVDNSLRFNTASTDYLTRAASAFGTPTNRKKCTISFWCKRSSLTVQQAVMGVETTPAGGANEARLILRGDDTLELYDYQSGYKFRYITNRVFRDTSAWLHIVFSVDTTHPTGSARVNLYINGVAETSFSSTTDPAEDLDTFLNSGNYVQLGRQSTGNSYYGGYLSEYVFIDGSALAPTDFGEFDEDSGIWKPKSVSDLSFGTNGFYLEFGNSGALGTDSSGEGNTFAVNNLAAINQTTDTCTNNFATLNVLNSTLTDTVLSEGNLKMVGGNQSVNYSYITSTIAVLSGKWYWEVKAVDNSEIDQVGVAKMDLAQFSNIATSSGLQATTYGGKGVQMSNGYKVGDGSGGAYMGGFSANDICMVALDLDNNKITFGRNGQWANGSGSANQTYGNSTAAFTNLTAGAMYAAAQCMRDSAGNNPGTLEYNFGNPTFSGTDQADGNDKGSFEYAPPTGFLSLCSKNLSEVNS